MTKLPAALLFVGLASAPAIASAGPNDNSSDRPWTLDIGVGPSVNLEGRGDFVFGKAGLDFHYHFKGGDVGPALGGQFLMHFRNHLFGFNVGPIFLWDFRVVTAGTFKLYLAPFVAAGYSLTNFTAGPVHGNSHAFFMDLGGQLKGVWNDRVGFFVRPTTFSVWAGQGGATGYYTFLTGLTLSF